MPRQSIPKLGQRLPVVSLPNHGFTLVEVLVVLAIMVILFGMLFVPITTSLEMTHVAQQRTQMNQTMRLAMEQIRRELSDAAWIFLPEIIDMGDGTYLVNYSNITFIPLSQMGALNPRVVRYAVHTPLTTRNPQTITVTVNGTDITYLVEQPTTVDNPFVLYRQEGYMVQHPITGANLFTNNPPGQPGIIGMPSSENAMTPVRSGDIPVTQTICLNASGVYIGEVDGYVYPADMAAVFTTGNPDRLVYIYGGIQFTPLRVEGDPLSAGANQTVYSAQHGHWAGLQNPGYRCTNCGEPFLRYYDICQNCGASGTIVRSEISVGEILWGTFIGEFIYSSELRPRIQVPRALLDTDTLAPSVGDPGAQDDGAGTIIYNMFDLRWNSVDGTVSVGLPYPDPAQAYAVFDLTAAPVPGGTWGYASLTTDISSVPGSDAATRPAATYDLEVLTADAPSGADRVYVNNPSEFQVTEDVRIVAPGAIPPHQEQCEVATVEATYFTIVGTLSQTYLLADNSYVEAVHNSALAYTTYTITPQPALATLDKMIVPESVRVWVEAYENTTSQQYVLEYSRSPADPDSLRYGQFQLVETAGAGSGDWRRADINFADSSGQVPPPSPEDPRTYGAPSNFDWTLLTDEPGSDYFYIWVEYQYRCNFDTADPDVDTYDIIDASYSTQEVYNIALEVMPYRELADQDGDGVWQPFGDATGVQMRGQVEVRNLTP